MKFFIYFVVLGAEGAHTGKDVRPRTLSDKSKSGPAAGGIVMLYWLCFKSQVLYTVFNSTLQYCSTESQSKPHESKVSHIHPVIMWV